MNINIKSSSSIYMCHDLYVHAIHLLRYVNQLQLQINTIYICISLYSLYGIVLHCKLIRVTPTYTQNV